MASADTVGYFHSSVPVDIPTIGDSGACPPTDINTDPAYYQNQGPPIHDQHAIGPFMLAGAAYLEALKPQDTSGLESSSAIHYIAFTKLKDTPDI
jgi:hypothetical protein